jgi:hypothetical protein
MNFRTLSRGTFGAASCLKSFVFAQRDWRRATINYIGHFREDLMRFEHQAKRRASVVSKYYLSQTRAIVSSNSAAARACSVLDGSAIYVRM